MPGQVVNIVVIVYGAVLNRVVTHAFLVLRKGQHFAFVRYCLDVIFICVWRLEQATLEIRYQKLTRYNDLI